jgi:5'-nucleotidase
MNILLTNDDGIEAKGLNVLAERFEKAGHSVYVIAPDSNRSAVSHHITMYNTNILKKTGLKSWACSGYPSDCVCIGLKSDLFDFKFDAVISGINEGANMGTDIIYSGTCGAARQAVLDGVPGIALSVNPEEWTPECRKNMKYEAMADFAVNNLKELIALASTEVPRLFVNVNGASRDSYLGVKYCKALCIRDYGDRLKILDNNGVSESHFVPGGAVAREDKDCDAYTVKEGYIAISRVYAEPLAAQIVDAIQFKV